ncbi:MAG: rRNA maturation RNase YbeY [Candidatus Nealsonbacteria bacterium]|nr:rRNA maturation RNase YbeY [Candidatus Nealsonbacteria bacterium]
MISVDVTNNQTCIPIDEQQFREAVRIILSEKGVARAQISVAVVDDATIVQLHQRFLGKDEPTDVLSFVLEQDEDHLEGEIVVSAETAKSTAGWYDWPPEHELLLYVIHGTLHMVGYDDATPEQRAAMRKAELAYLARLEIHQPQETGNSPREEPETPE